MSDRHPSFEADPPRPTSSKAHARPTPLALSLALLAVLALSSFAAPTPAGAAKASPAAKVTISTVSVSNKKVTVAGQVKLPAGTAPSRAKVLLSLLDSTGKVEKATGRPDAKGRFKVIKTTALTGDLTAVAAVKIAGKASGRQVSKRFAGPPTPAAAPAGSTKAGGGTPTGTPLVGLFEIEEGKQAVNGKITGTYFKMGGVTNADSPFFSKEFTPLSPGTDGGLSTVEYQPAPTPAFGSPTPNALANRIVQPQTFFQIKFGIATDSVGRGTNSAGGLTEEPTPLPVILNDHGNLSGQVSAWTAAWSTLWFNQGSPKPNGSLSGGTTSLTGTYDAATGHYQMSWSSLIEGGAFGGFIGSWYLEGTFVPAS